VEYLLLQKKKKKALEVPISLVGNLTTTLL